MVETNRIYTEKNLVDFGNYILSSERKNILIHESNSDNVTDADIANFNEQLKEKDTNLFQECIKLMKAHAAETDPDKKSEILKQIEGLTQEMNLSTLKINSSDL